MQKTIEIQGKPVEIFTSREADAVLSSRNLPLLVEMDLLFDSLVSKKVRFLSADQSAKKTVSVNDKLFTRFRPVMTHCEEHDHQRVCWLMDFPIVKQGPYIPKWLRIDFRFGHWFGEFGY